MAKATMTATSLTNATGSTAFLSAAPVGASETGGAVAEEEGGGGEEEGLEEELEA
jgi:hypothetical protein